MYAIRSYYAGLGSGGRAVDTEKPPNQGGVVKLLKIVIAALAAGMVAVSGTALAETKDGRNNFV